MCPRDTPDYLTFTACNHTLPRGACTQYAPKLRMCLSDPVMPIRFNFSDMRCGGRIDDLCGFCKVGKDPSGGFGFGEMWAAASRWR